MLQPDASVHIVRLRRRPCFLWETEVAHETDYSRLITETTIIWDVADQRVSMVYIAAIAEDTTALVNALRRLSVPMTQRQSGMRSRWRAFGYTTRNPGLQQDSCTSAALGREEPQTDTLLRQFAGVVNAYYHRYGPGVHAAHQRMAADVLPDYRIERSPFTGGVVNKDSALPYHYDRGNFNHVWSAMLALRSGVQGGHLVVPAYDLAFEIADKSVLMFDGQGLLHGVTPCTREPDGYRFTIVYYSREDMWDCLPPTQELERIQRKETERRRRHS